jgi:uncharacterized protein YbjT (DUF2867 family)
VTPSGPIAITGATGYVGGLLARELRDRGAEVRALARSPAHAQELAQIGCELRRADVLEPATLTEALQGAEVAYYLVHAMGRGAGGGFVERDLRGASNFAAAAKDAGLERIVYLGGLGGGTEHLDSRHATADRLGETGVPVTYLRAAAVIGAGSESFRTVLYLVRRLPVMVTPRWTATRTQPIAIADVVAYLAQAGELAEAKGSEVQIGGPDVMTYAEMMDLLAAAMDRRAPLKIPVPALTPWLSSLWVGLVTPVDAGVARPLIEGLATETVVTDPSGIAGFDVEPTPIATAMREALAELDA